MAAASTHRGQVDGRAAALGGAVLAHAALLTPLALGALGLELDLIEEGEAPTLPPRLLDAPKAPSGALPSDAGPSGAFARAAANQTGATTPGTTAPTPA